MEDVQRAESSAKSGSLRSSISRSRATAPMRRTASRTIFGGAKSPRRSGSSQTISRRLSLIRLIRRSVRSRKKSQHCAARSPGFSVSLRHSVRSLRGQRVDDLPESLDVLAEDCQLVASRPVAGDEEAAAVTDQQRERPGHVTAGLRCRAGAREFTERLLDPLPLPRHSAVHFAVQRTLLKART